MEFTDAATAPRAHAAPPRGWTAVRPIPEQRSVTPIVAAPVRRTVVGAAIIRDGAVLSARRSAPHAVAGMWEFPGGKVEPGESDEAALRRELREELGLTVQVGERIGPDLPLPSGRHTLKVWLVELDADQTPVILQDHDELRWLRAGQVFDVPWLPGDLPVVELIEQHLARADRVARV